MTVTNEWGSSHKLMCQGSRLIKHGLHWLVCLFAELFEVTCALFQLFVSVFAVLQAIFNKPSIGG